MTPKQQSPLSTSKISQKRESRDELLDISSPIYARAMQPKLSKEEITARLKNLALTSESGSCSVLEVIDPSSDESEGEAVEFDEDFINDLESSKEIREEVMKPKMLPEKRFKRLSKSRYDHGLGGFSSRNVNEGTTSSDSGGDAKDSSATAISSDAGTISSKNSQKHIYSSNLKLNSNHFLASEASAEAVVSDASQVGNQRHEVPNIIEEQEVSMKRKGFLHKFSIKPKWPSNKRKITKPYMRKEDRKEDGSNVLYGSVSGFDSCDPSRAEVFNERCVDRDESLEKEQFEKYETKKDETIERPEHSQDNNVDSSPGDTDMQTTPEISTSSSQEYSHNNSSSNNSSEESSIGKPVKNASSLPRVHDSSLSKMQGQHSLCLPPLRSANSSPPPPPIPQTRRPPPPPTANLGSLVPLGPRLTKEHFSPRLSKEVLLEEDNEESLQQISELDIRPESSASKFEPLSRPGSSTSSFPTYKSDQLLLQKSNLSLTHDLLPATDSSTGGRMSPAPSEVSKTESALSPPSHASDVSKSESARISVSKTGSLSTHSSQSNSTHSSLHSKDLPLSDDVGLRNQVDAILSSQEKLHLSIMAKNDSSPTKLSAGISSEGSKCMSNMDIKHRQVLYILYNVYELLYFMIICYIMFMIYSIL